MNHPARKTDRELFEAVSNGDVTAFAELANRHARGLYDFSLRGTQDEHQAASVLTTVFQRVREAADHAPSQIDFRTWLYSLCLVEVLGLANETRTARISTDDERFYRRTNDVDPEIAHWAWQAARGLRTRDYCVLDLTLRRGLTPEEVAEAASLTRSNLYASIGRARGAFEESFAAMLLFEHGRGDCAELDEMIENSPGGLRPALRHQIVEHTEDCDACRRTLDTLPLAANVYLSLADIDVPEGLQRGILGDTAVLDQEAAAATEPASPAPPAETAASAALAAGTAALDPALDNDNEDDDGWSDEDEAAFAGEDLVESDLDEGSIEELADGGEPEDTVFDEGEPRQDEAHDMAPAAAAGGLAMAGIEPAPVPVTPIHREEHSYEEGQSLLDRVAAWVDGSRGQPLLWTYALLGVAAVIAIYLGIAVADSLQSGGRDSGAVPLDATPGSGAAQEIGCGDAPIELDAGGFANIVSFDEGALEGFQISTLSIQPASEDASFEDLEATVETPYSIRFVAPEQEADLPRSEEFLLNIEWMRGEESASSTCQLLVNVAP